MGGAVCKEPHTDSVEYDDGFWFKQCVDRKGASHNRAETKYINVLGRLAGVILGKNINNVEKCKNILKSCAYMNLYPFSGERLESAKFSEVLAALRNTSPSTQIYDISKYSSAEEIAANRLAIICNLIYSYQCRYIITPQNIFGALHKVCGNAEKKCWMKYGKYKFYYFEFKGTRFLEFWHPAYTYISNKLRDNFIKYIVGYKQIQGIENRK